MEAIQYPYGDALPEPGTAMELATEAGGQGVRWIRMPLPYALNHINLWLIEDGAEGWCAVDTGMDMGDVKQHWQTLIAQYLLTRQIVTHYHPDHLGLAAWLQEKIAGGLSVELIPGASQPMVWTELLGNANDRPWIKVRYYRLPAPARSVADGAVAGAARGTPGALRPERPRP